MSKKFKSQASSARAATSLTGGFAFASSFQTKSSPLSYVTELPDLSQISEPNVVVAFKNLGKKDSTTKTRALEELQECCVGNVEQEILQAWADIYPRTSIDNSRRVRQLAHTLQGNLTISAGKRIAPLLPKVIPSWLGGTLDNDKTVSRSAHDALEKSFTTTEKRNVIWSLYKNAIFEHIEDAITSQTAATLSDERTTSSDDAQAKYVRVVGTAINMLAQLLRGGAQNDLITTLLNGKKIWEFACHEDPYLRRSACELVTIAADAYSNQLDWTMISTCFVSKALHSDQSGSSRQYTAALLALTQRRPEIWTTEYTAKTPASKRLIQFLRRGSQNGPEDVWSNIAALVRLIPEQVWSTETQIEGATNLTEAIRTGVSQSAERVNASAAWTAYAQISFWLLSKLVDDQATFIQQQLVPIVNQYVTKKEDQQWKIPTRAVNICRGIAVGIVKNGIIPAFESMWLNLVSATIDEMKLSHPETSKDFRSSQDAVVEQAKRLYGVKKEMMKSPESKLVSSIFEKADDTMLEASIQILRTRNGKPYGAAGVIEIIINQQDYNKNNREIQDFVQGDLLSLLSSPSAEQLASIALICGQTTIIDVLLSQRSENADKAIQHVLTRIDAGSMSTAIQDRVTNGNFSIASDRQMMAAAMQNPALTQVHAAICDKIKQSISLDSAVGSQQAGLTLLQELLKQSIPSSVIVSEEHRAELLPSVLVLADSISELSEQASTIATMFNSKAKSTAGSVTIVQQQLSAEGPPLSILTLIDLANSVLRDSGTDPNAIMPTEETWSKALLPHNCSPRPFSLSITSPLQGLIYAMRPALGHDRPDIPRDQDDFSLLFRLTIYVTRLLTSDNASLFEMAQHQSLYSAYPIALQLVNEKLTIENSNEIWVRTTPEVIYEATDVLSEGVKLVQSWLSNPAFTSYWLTLLHNIKGDDLIMYTTITAWTSIATQYIDQQGPTKLLQAYDSELRSVHKSENLACGAALLSVLGEYLPSTSYGKQVLNELVAGVTDLKGNSIAKLVLLNLLVKGDSEAIGVIPARRLVLLFTNLLHLLDDRETVGMQSEVLKLLSVIVSQVQDIYGDHWEQLLNKIIALWTTDMDISVVNSSARVYARLESLLRNEDVNEDLQDVWKTAKPELSTGLLVCLQLVGQTTLEIDQPRVITAELIRRQLRDVELNPDDSVISLLASPVEAVQTAAFEILHRIIPQQQEELSVELVLGAQNARLSQDLVSMLTNDEDDPRGYMLAWKLIFDHFSKASYKLREAYTKDIKESGHFDKMLNYIIRELGIVSGRPVDASRYDIIDFDIIEAASSEKMLQWLAIHNYYNALLDVPGLAKDWFISQNNRVKTPLGTWTQKYISPLIVSASLSVVTEWANTQMQDEDDRPLTIKSSPRASELAATIVVDPESPPISITISLPGSYPLESPTVVSRTRVGVSEKNWHSWLKTIQIIIFSTGSIIEGLIAFRRNVQGALKGQSECAICYSIIGTDMQTPNKKCGTCKNNFHGTCLFRWFKSSNSSSCPLCRNNFNYA